MHFMATTMLILAWVLFSLCIVAGLLLDLVGLFGNWVILLGAVAFWGMTGLEHFGFWGLGGMLLFAVIGEVLETALAGYGAKKFGGSKGSIVAALVGCLVGSVVGTPLFPIIGTLIGAVLGAFAFAAGYEYIQFRQGVGMAAKVGVGAALGKIGGLIAKFACGVAMLGAAFFTY
jgi:uncharacterized protein YqgC (DUF456 family)